MGERENREIQDEDLDVLVRQAQEREAGLDSRQALGILTLQLGTSQGYYTWATLGEAALATWIVRFPREDLDDEEWLRDEAADFLHICQPLQYVEAVERKDKEASSKYVGYVRDTNGELIDQSEFKCMKCKHPTPELQAKAAKSHMALHKLKRKL